MGGEWRRKLLAERISAGTGGENLEHKSDGSRQADPWYNSRAGMVNHAQQGELMKLFSEEEVCMAIKGLNAKGAPGLDGLPVFFYTVFWELVGPEVMAMLDEFWQGMKNMEKINRSHLFLLQKCRGAIRVKDLDPSHCPSLFNL